MRTDAAALTQIKKRSEDISILRAGGARRVNAGKRHPHSIVPAENTAPGAARDTVEVIFEATALILQREGRDTLTTNHIAERAGVTISTLYQLFRNKEAIVVAFTRREMELALGAGLLRAAG